MKTKRFATIHDWVEIKGYGGKSFLIGHILNHPDQNKFGTLYQQTSPIVHMDRAAGTCETENTIYTLGKEDNGAT